MIIYSNKIELNPNEYIQIEVDTDYPENPISVAKYYFNGKHWIQEKHVFFDLNMRFFSPEECEFFYNKNITYFLEHQRDEYREFQKYEDLLSFPENIQNLVKSICAKMNNLSAFL